jgi:ubiquinone/menaquinone biosynthesis C-methylase UbiE
MELIGLNIDERQILRAQKQTTAIGANTIRFQQGDACFLPFADNSCDVVLAVECIFHFSSREQFFKEVYRVLKPGGYLALSDFLLSKKVSRFHDLNIFKFLINGFFGTCNVQYTKEKYYSLALQNNFSIEFDENITKNTLPTYRFLKSLVNKFKLYKLYKFKIIAFAFTILCIEQLSKRHLLEYYAFSFRKPLNHSERQPTDATPSN